MFFWVFPPLQIPTCEVPGHPSFGRTENPTCIGPHGFNQHKSRYGGANPLCPHFAAPSVCGGVLLPSSRYPPVCGSPLVDKPTPNHRCIVWDWDEDEETNGLKPLGPPSVLDSLIKIGLYLGRTELEEAAVSKYGCRFTPRIAGFSGGIRMMRSLLILAGMEAEDAIRYTLHSWRHLLPTMARQLRLSGSEQVEIGHWSIGPAMPKRYDAAACVTEWSRNLPS